MNADDEIARCDREIERICEQARKGNPDVRGILQGLFDWEVEKALILSERQPPLLAPNWQIFPACYGTDSQRADHASEG